MKKLGFIIGTALGGGLGYLAGNWKKESEPEEAEEEKHVRLVAYYDILTRWMTNKQDGLNIADYLTKKGYRKVAIYGHGKIGILLYGELREKADLKVECFIDTMTEEKFKSIDGIFSLPIFEVDLYKQVDAIIVTPTFVYEVVEKDLRAQSYQGDILRLDSILYDM